MKRAAVPEAAVKKYGELGLGEDKVRFHGPHVQKSAQPAGAIGQCRRQPTTRAWRSAAARVCSVDAFRVERIDRMIAERFAALKMSLMLAGGMTCGGRETCRH